MRHCCSYFAHYWHVLHEGMMTTSSSSLKTALCPVKGWCADAGLSPLLMEHEMGGSGLMNPPNARRWHWLPVSPDDNPTQWAHSDIWERYPLQGQHKQPHSWAPPSLPIPRPCSPEYSMRVDKFSVPAHTDTNEAAMSPRAFSL